MYGGELKRQFMIQYFNTSIVRSIPGYIQRARSAFMDSLIVPLHLCFIPLYQYQRVYLRLTHRMKILP